VCPRYAWEDYDILGIQWYATTLAQQSGQTTNWCDACVGPPEPPPPHRFWNYDVLESFTCEVPDDGRAQLHVKLEVDPGIADLVAQAMGSGCPGTGLLTADCGQASAGGVKDCAADAGYGVTTTGPGTSPVLVHTNSGDLYAKGWRDPTDDNTFHFVVERGSGARTVTGFRLATQVTDNAQPPVYHAITGATAQAWCEHLTRFTVRIHPRPERDCAAGSVVEWRSCPLSCLGGGRANILSTRSSTIRARRSTRK
jgi:hypothetical protein